MTAPKPDPFSEVRDSETCREDVCRQTGLKIVLCVWDASSSWGLQVADYGLWALQRKLDHGDDSWHSRYIGALESTVRFPWGQ